MRAITVVPAQKGSVALTDMPEPPQEDGPVNSLAKMYVEVDGKQFSDWTRELTYSEIPRT